MAKGKGKKGRRGPKKGGGGDSSESVFHFQWLGALVSGTAALTLNSTGLATLSTRFLAQADSWVFFRYKKFRFRMHCANTSANQAVGFIPLTDAGPSTIAQLMELSCSAYMDQTQTVPSEWHNVNSNDLRGPFPWYRTIDGTFDSSEEYPARMVIVGTGTDAYSIEFYATVEFKEGAAPANIPFDLALLKQKRQDRIDREIAKQRVKLLALLATSAPGSSLGVLKP